MYAELKADAINRITAEVKKARKEFEDLGYTEYDIVDDDEVRPELINLIRIIMEECDESKS